MADPTTFPEETTSAPVVYRRLSGFAVASLVLAALFAVGLVMAAVLAMGNRTPLLLPVWLQTVPVIGAVLALIALFLIRQSEGTLAGGKAAIWGWWLSVVSGLGYWAYLGATYFAVNQQAERFVVAWFDKVKAGEMGSAFLDSQNPADRASINPKDEKQINDKFLRVAQAASSREGTLQMPMDLFRRNGIVRLAELAGNATEIKALGVQEWEYKQGYHVKRLYQVTNEEGTTLVAIKTVGVESKTNEFQGRQWSISLTTESAIRASHPTPLGLKLEELRSQTRKFVEAWGNKLGKGNIGGALVDTLEPAQRAPFLAADIYRLAGTTFAAGTLPTEGLLGDRLAGCLPALSIELAVTMRRSELHELLKRANIIHTDKLQADTPETRAAALAGLDSLMGNLKSGLRFAYMQIKPDRSLKQWQYEHDRFRVVHEAVFGFMPPVGPQSVPMLYRVDGKVTVESDPGAFELNRRYEWRIVSVDLDRATETNPMAEAAASGARPPRPPPPPGVPGMSGQSPGPGGPPGRTKGQ
jgi:hypothetical protein